MAFTPTDPTKAEVRVTGSAPNQQLDFYIPAGPAGPPNTLTVLGTTTGTSNPAPYETRGTGSPEGSVTASPGTYYTDTNGTNGAWRWIKVSGAGNTGWAVVFGYFRRDITSVCTAAGMSITGGNVFLVRSQQAWEIQLSNVVTSTSSVTLNLGTGWDGTPGDNRSMDFTNGGIVLTGWTANGSTANRWKTSGLLMPTSWPTSLPGTAA